MHGSLRRTPGSDVAPQGGSRLAEFQQNAAFAAFMVIVVSAALILVVMQLRTVLIPLIWAAFFALPLEKSISQLNNLFTRGFGFLVDSCCKDRLQLQPVVYTRRQGTNAFVIANTPENRAMLRRLRNPLSDTHFGKLLSTLLCCSCARALSDTRRLTCRRLGVRCSVVLKCCQRRLKITQVNRPAGSAEKPQRSVNCVSMNWCYYVGHVSMAGSDLQLELFHDQGCCEYPAIVECPDEDSAELADETGVLEMDRTSTTSWALAFLTVAVILVGALILIGVMVYYAVLSFVSNMDSYEKGVTEVIDWIRDKMQTEQMRELLETIREQLQEFLKTSLAELAEGLVANISGIVFQQVLFLIYLLFWLFAPIPVASPVVEVFKTYLYLKTFICLLFALLMSGLLAALGCQLWPVFLVMTFVLNYIPEIGALISGLLALPAVLLDANAGSLQSRCAKACYLVVLGLLFKFITGNVLEVHMYTTRGGEFMRMHSLVLMALIMTFGSLLGVTGMFLAVPFVAAFKYYLVSADLPSSILDPMLCFIEGDQLAVHKSFVDGYLVKGDSSEPRLLSLPCSMDSDGNNSRVPLEMMASGTSCGGSRDALVAPTPDTEVRARRSDPLLQTTS